MDRYIPPFTISNKMLEYVSSISEKVGGINSRHMLDNKPHLRKNNRIKSIHSSLRIEANSLSLSEVRDVINGKVVIGDRKEIQEVKNAYLAYAKIKETDPYSVSELKRIHGIMTAGIEEESAHEHCVADLAIAIQINSIEVVYYILTNHLTLHMTCFGSIGSNECTLVIAA